MRGLKWLAESTHCLGSRAAGRAGSSICVLGLKDKDGPTLAHALSALFQMADLLNELRSEPQGKGLFDGQSY